MTPDPEPAIVPRAARHRARAGLGIDPGLADTRTILDLTRDVAHQVDRPAAPMTASLLGIAVGRGQPLGATAGRLTALAGSGR